MAGLSVWACDRPRFTPEVFECWSNGLPVEEAVRKRLDISHLGSAANIVLGDTKDQYLLFKQVEPFLRDPIAFRNQDIYCFSHDDRRHLIYTYYRYDAEFMRKILGRYLSKGMRKDLDEVAEEVKLTLSSCCRQFDNLRRIYKTVEDHSGQLSKLIEQSFLLEPSLARDYAAMVFITDNRLAIDKKVLQNVPLSVFLDCAHEFMREWTTVHEIGGNDQDLQKKFLQELREIKFNIIGSKDVLDRLYTLVASQMSMADDARLNRVMPVLKAIVQIGGALSYSKEWRDIFEDLMQEVAFPLRTMNWSVSETTRLMKALNATFQSLPLPQEFLVRSAETFQTFCSTISKVLTIML
eukprot:gene544-3862_t